MKWAHIEKTFTLICALLDLGAVNLSFSRRKPKGFRCRLDRRSSGPPGTSKLDDAMLIERSWVRQAEARGRILAFDLNSMVGEDWHKKHVPSVSEKGGFAA